MWVTVRTAYSLSGVSAPFSLTVLNIQVFPASASTICTHTQKKLLGCLPFVPLGYINVFPCLHVNCYSVTSVYL